MRTASPARFTVFLVGSDQCSPLIDLLREAGYETKIYTALKTFSDEHDPAVHGCILFDLSLAELNDFDIRSNLERKSIKRPVIFLTNGKPATPSAEACKNGAMYFFLKLVNKVDLLRAIRVAARQDSDRLHFNAVAKRFATLTTRELQILALVARHLPNKNIAAELKLREKTIEVNRSRAMKKLGTKNVFQLVRLSKLVERQIGLRALT
jgi:FixJ family two-component response regulator